VSSENKDNKLNFVIDNINLASSKSKNERFIYNLYLGYNNLNKG